MHEYQDWTAGLVTLATSIIILSQEDGGFGEDQFNNLMPASLEAEVEAGKQREHVWNPFRNLWVSSP